MSTATELLDGWQAFWELIAAEPAERVSRPVAALLTGSDGETLVRQVYKGEPFTEQQPSGTIVTLSTATMDDPFQWALTLRIYSTLKERPLDAQQAVAETVCVIDGLMDAKSALTEWAFGVNEPTESWVAETTYTFGRTVPSDRE